MISHPYRGYRIDITYDARGWPFAVIRDPRGHEVHRSVGVAMRSVSETRESARRWIARQTNPPKGRSRDRSYTEGERKELDRRRQAAKTQSRDGLGRFG